MILLQFSLASCYFLSLWGHEYEVNKQVNTRVERPSQGHK